MKDKYNDSIKDLITSFLTGEITSSDEKNLSLWRAESPENEKLFNEYRKIFEISRKAASPEISEIDLDAEWEHFVKLTGNRDVKVVQFENKTHQNWYKIAAVLAVVALSVFAVNYFLSGPGDVVFQTAETGQRITLPDGSTVELNRNSMLSYSKEFGDRSRSLTLDGEAYFDVVPDSDNPFSISVNGTTVEVLGTAFNVSGYADSPGIEVIVEEGLVSFSDGQKVIELAAGEKGTYSRSSKQLFETVNEDINYLAWKTRKLVFVESGLDQVVAAINQVYGDKIVLKIEARESCQVTVTFSDQSLEAILNVLKTTLDLTYIERDDRIEIVDARCE